MVQTKLFLDLYLTKFLTTSTKVMFDQFAGKWRA